MNPREPSRTRLRVRTSPRILALLLLPVLAPEEAGATPRPRPSVNMALRFIPEPPIAYLRNIDPVPLRFETEPLPPAPWPQSLEAPPPVARSETTFVPDGSIPVEESPGLPVTETGQSTTPPSGGFSSNGAMPSLATPGPESSSAASPVRMPAPILVDELRPTVRPEDFLPYFILPGSPAGETGTSLIVPVPPQPPAPPAQPASSARFIQTR